MRRWLLASYQWLNATLVVPWWCCGGDYDLFTFSTDNWIPSWMKDLLLLCFYATNTDDIIPFSSLRFFFFTIYCIFLSSSSIYCYKLIFNFPLTLVPIFISIFACSYNAASSIPNDITSTLPHISSHHNGKFRETNNPDLKRMTPVQVPKSTEWNWILYLCSPVINSAYE